MQTLYGQIFLRRQVLLLDPNTDTAVSDEFQIATMLCQKGLKKQEKIFLTNGRRLDKPDWTPDKM